MKITNSIRWTLVFFNFLIPVLCYGKYEADRTPDDSLQLDIKNYVSGTDSIMKITPAQPEAGSLVKFVYSGQFSEKLMPKFTVYFDKGSWQTLKTKRTTRGIEGSFTIPDSVLSFTIKPANNLRDANESLIYLVYKKGKPLPGSLAAAAVNYKRPDYNSNLHMDIARLLYRREFKLHPELRAKYLLDYLASASWKPDSLIIREIHKSWLDSMQNAENDHFLTRLYNLTQRFFWLNDKETFKAQLLARFPDGDLAFAEARKDLEKSGVQYPQKLNEIETKYRSEFALAGLDQIYSQRSRMELDRGELENAGRYIRKIRSKYVLKEAYMTGARRLLLKKKALDTAVSFMKKALDLYAFQMQPLTDEPYQPNDSGLKYVKAGLLDLYAQVLHERGDLKLALLKIEEARSTESSGTEINEHYLNYLLESEDYKLFQLRTAASKQTSYLSRLKLRIIWHSSNQVHQTRPVIIIFTRGLQTVSTGHLNYQIIASTI